MRRREFLAATLVLPFAARAEPPPIRVVASFSILADFTQRVGGSRVAVRALVGPDADAHVYEPSPGDLRMFTGASLVVLNGLGFEGWMPRLLRAARYSGQVVTASEGVQPLRARDHDDPHAWQDPRLARIYVNNVLSGLVRAVPALSRSFEEAAARFVDELNALDAELRRRFAAIPAKRRRVITTHDAFAYLGAAYGVEFLPLQGWTTASEASAADVARLVRTARAQDVAAAFVENVTDPRLVESVAAESGIRIGGRLYSDALASAGHPASTYLGMMRHNAETLLAALAAPAEERRT